MTNTTQYLKCKRLSDNQILEKAAEIIAQRYLRGEALVSSQATKDYLQYKLAHNDREVFAVLLLDNQHQIIKYHELFFGTIDAATIYPREVVKLALDHNAAAVIFAHNHPSGDPTPSNADQRMTQKLKEALALIDVRVLDHVVVGKSCVSFSERGLV
ncbi:RadC family protein [Photobacterium damselae]|uniref:RadC family protein n=1 Tax=Photobacterium damselae TaxID=38293 RepID=UPI001EDE8658|nr:DNA repair protein RadC [Photobacterium damselae]MCG3826655.1 DNA repair protein RadC [Photobacterium damselae]